MLRAGAIGARLRAAYRPYGHIRHHSNIHDRYAGKLKAKAAQSGLKVEELLEQAKPAAEKVRLEAVADLRKQALEFQKRAKAQREAASSGADKGASAPSPDSESLDAIKGSKPLTMELDSFIDVQKLQPHSAKEIEMLWKARFLNSTNAFSGSMTPESFSRLYLNARKYPTFVLPLPHKAHGIELHYVQWSFVTSETVYCLLTSLAQYKLHNEYAHPHTTFMLHTNLAADKQIILTNSVIQNNEVSTENAALLVLNLQRFYATDPNSEHGKAKAELLKQFNTGDTSFSVDRLLEATETLD